MKKILTVALSALLVGAFLFSGCDNGTKAENPTKNPVENPDKDTQKEPENQEDPVTPEDPADPDPVTPEDPVVPEDPEEEIIYVTKIDGSKLTGDFVSIDLGAFKGKTVKAEVVSSLYVVNNGGHNEGKTDSANLMWQINTATGSYPIIASHAFEKGTTDWTAVSSAAEGVSVTIGSDGYPYFYLSRYQLTTENLTVYIKDFELKITPENEAAVSFSVSDLRSNDEAVSEVDIETIRKDGDSEEPDPDAGNDVDENANWLSDSVPSVKEAYADIFDSIGIAAEYGNFGLACSGDKYTGTYTQAYWGTPSELYYDEVQNGIAKHANSITLGNELKPQFLLQWWKGDGSAQTMVDFTGSNGKTIKVPNKLNGESLIYATLNVCKKMGVQMRGHVLTWHSQTPDGFFAEGYKPEYNEDGTLISNLVDKETMTARHEWYIKTVLDCVAAWESANNYRAIWAWDVVNEAMADDAGKIYSGENQNWLRGSTDGTKDKSPEKSGSRWYQVYGSEEFIINAFRFANAYAPSDVKLCYNDYNEYMDYDLGWKTSAIENIASLIKAGASENVNGNSVAPRLDVIAMQSHVGVSWPGVAGYENALKRFLQIADVHVSEIDFSAETQEQAANCYGEYFAMLKKYGKNYSGEHKVTNVTIWGVNNESSWINPSYSGGKKTFPLLFSLINNVDVNKKDVVYDTGEETLPQYDIGDSYKPNDAFWAVINAAK